MQFCTTYNGRIISLKIHYGKDNEYQVEFKDSYLFSKAFGVEVPKPIYPHLFVNENKLNYIGSVPEFK